ncbi:MAG: DNA alkylation repair protein [Candidatus Margulisiibacteriota bacterium]
MQIEIYLRSLASKEKAKILSGFFKTGPGQYGEGDVFLGITVPKIRKAVKAFEGITLAELKILLGSKYHEERLAALLILVAQYKKGDEFLRKKIFQLYLTNTRHINNWDLVDLSAEHIVGQYLSDRPKDLLYKLAKSKDLWERRISVLSTFAYIKEGECDETLKISEMLLKDDHDLIHKAVGWMLREVGKRCSMQKEEAFLKKHYKIMPRTMLRYAIERFPEKKRQMYLRGQV